MKKIYLLILLLSLLTPIFSQEMGKPLMRVYSIDEYNWHPQNWAAIQDNRGVMYFANGLGVLEFDGIEWRKIIVPNTTIIRSFAKDTCGRIYVGGAGEFGYLAPDELGDMKYFSLSNELDTAYQYFNDIWFTIYSPDGIYFCSRKYLFRYNYHNAKKKDQQYQKNSFTVWEAGIEFLDAYLVNNTIYVNDSKYGLKYLENDSLILVSNGEVFKDNICRSIYSYAKNKLLAIFPLYGIQLFNSKNNISSDSILVEYKIGINSFLKEKSMYKITKLPNGNFVFATEKGGVLITTEKFEPIQLIDKNAGLTSNACRYSYYSDGILWLVMDDAIVSVELDSPFKIWDENLGVNTSVSNLVRFNKKIYISTVDGVYYLDTTKFINAFSQNSFVKIPGLDELCWCFSVVETEENNKRGKSLFVGTISGVYEIKNGKIGNKISDEYTLTLLNSKISPNILFIGYLGGFSYMYKNKKNNKWEKNENFIDIETNNIRTICEDNDSNIWFSDYKYIYKALV
ncbi:MAG: hypothetical protein JXL97_03945 [Bacteroidales bacterium]|nr:hypothetical protein [Bacteroidales bacterium]